MVSPINSIQFPEKRKHSNNYCCLVKIWCFWTNLAIKACKNHDKVQTLVQAKAILPAYANALLLISSMFHHFSDIWLYNALHGFIFCPCLSKYCIRVFPDMIVSVYRSSMFYKFYLFIHFLLNILSFSVSALLSSPFCQQKSSHVGSDLPAGLRTAMPFRPFANFTGNLKMRRAAPRKETTSSRNCRTMNEQTSKIYKPCKPLREKLKSISAGIQNMLKSD